LKKYFNGKELSELCFSESVSYNSAGRVQDARIYMAKVTGSPNIKYIPFDKTFYTQTGSVTQTIYRGEGTIQFTAYWPYARGYNQVSETPYTGEAPAPFTVSGNNIVLIKKND
jgi:hypothetical protein